MNQHAEKVDVLYSCLPKSLEWIKFRFRFSITIKNVEVFLLNRRLNADFNVAFLHETQNSDFYTFIYEAPLAIYTAGINNLYLNSCLFKISL